jgi:hypothetical protein
MDRHRKVSDNASTLGIASSLDRGEVLGQKQVSCSHKLTVLCIEVCLEGTVLALSFTYLEYEQAQCEQAIGQEITI